MFLLCSHMKWNHLPLAGGIYDQHPELLEKFSYIFMKMAEQEEADRKKQEQDQKRTMGRQSRVAGRRR